MTDQEKLYRINLISVLEDVQHQLLMELEPELRHVLKMKLNQCIFHIKRFIKECDRINTDTTGFGIDADELRETLDKIFIKP